MAQTVWYPRTKPEHPRTWLLANGEILSEPPLELSATGRKARVAGANASVFIKDMDTLILNEVEAQAAQKRTRIWMPQKGLPQKIESKADFKPAETRPELYLMKPPDEQQKAMTIAWWRFRHPTLPIEALLHIKVSREKTGWNNRTLTGNEVLRTELTFPDTRPNPSMIPQVLNEITSFTSMLEPLEAHPRTVVSEFLRDNPSTKWNPDSILGQQSINGERALVQALVTKIHQIDELDSIELLDLRVENKPKWLELELDETNVNASFLSDLTEYLDGTPTIEEALRLYDELRECMRNLGIVMEERSENDFQRGLLGDDPAGVTVLMGPISDENGHSKEHTLRMHLPSGTFIVDCSVKVDLNAVAEQWEESKVVASLSGEEDTLLAFAREVSKRDSAKRARTIIKARKG